MRCLYCGKQLALFRRLTGSGEFCSEAHKQSYHDEYNRLALTRLMAAQAKSEETRPVLSGRAIAALPAPERPYQQKALPEAQLNISNNRWLEAAPRRAAPAQAVALQEAPAPPASSFLRGGNPKAKARSPLLTEQLPEPAPIRLQPQFPSWAPAFVEGPDPEPADVFAVSTLPVPRAPSAEVGGTYLMQAGAPAPFAAGEAALSITALPRIPGGRFAVRMPAPLDPLRLTPPVTAAPRRQGVFEQIPFYFVAMAAPPVESPRRAAPAPGPVMVPATPASAKRLFETTPFAQEEPSGPAASASTESRRPSSMKLKVAAMTAAPPPVPVASSAPRPYENGRMNSAAASPAVINGRAPASRAEAESRATRRTIPIPSILEPMPPQKEESRSIWSSLKRYIKG